MKRFITVLLTRRTLVYFRLATGAVLCAICPVAAFAQLPTNRSLADKGVEPFATCGRNSPATTRMTLSSKKVGKGVTAETSADFFLPADADRRQVISLIDANAKGSATITTFIDSKHATVEITEAFDSQSFKDYTWGRWPLCYMSTAARWNDSAGRALTGRYGFNAGGGHNKWVNTPNLVLDRGQQYSVDRCSLAHDSGYWGDGCNNDHWVQFCFQKIWPKTVEEDAALQASTRWYGRHPDLWVFSIGMPNRCDPKVPWVELPTNANWIRSAEAVCYGTDGRLVVGYQDLVLDVNDWDKDNRNGANVIVGKKSSGCNQKWRMVPGTGNPARYGYEIRGLGGKCVGTPARRPKRGDPVQMWDCSGRYTQKWHHEHGQIRSQPAEKGETRLCLTVKSLTAPREVIVWGCGSHRPGMNKNQQWTFATE